MNPLRLFTFALLLLAVALAGCESSLTDTEAPNDRATVVKPALRSSGALADGFNKGDDDDDDDDDKEKEKVKVSGDDVALRFATAGFNELYNFEVEQEEGDTDGWFHVIDFHPGEKDNPFTEVRGDVTCVSIDPDGRTARLGGVVTSSTSNGTRGFYDGAFAVWTVLDNGDGDDRDRGNGDGDDDEDDWRDDRQGVEEVTDIRFGPNVSEDERDFHCAVGYPNSTFGMENFGCDFNPETGLCRTNGKIKVETDD